MNQLPDLDDCRAAARTIERQIHRTPMFSSRSLSEVVGREVHLKAELFQRTGSFKLRGAINRVAALSEQERACGAVTVSAGNHAQAAALACAAPASISSSSCRAAQARSRSRRPAVTARRVDLDAADGAEAFARMYASRSRAAGSCCSRSMTRG